jgi:catechol 2,3-dioxygenase-like lactoylglutathione lyase family enzyme
MFPSRDGSTPLREGTKVMPSVQGFSHIALTVTDSKRSADFYSALFGAQVVDASDAISPFHVCVADSLMIGFRAHAGAAGDTFDHNRVGLDHLAFAVENAAELDAWQARLTELGAENSGIVEDPGGVHLNAHDPDNIAIEFYVAPGG